MKDKVWLWCHPAGAHDGRWQLPKSAAGPGDGLAYFGIENAIYVVFGNRPEPPFAPHALEFSEVRQLVWSIIGDASSDRNDKGADIDPVLKLAEECPNLVGAITDDFFLPEPASDGTQARLKIDQFARCRDALKQNNPSLDVWTVVYDSILKRPLEPYLEMCDVVTYWTWEAANLVHLESNFAAVEKLAPNCRKLLGCYMWDYGSGGGEVPAPLMREQCRLAEEWIESRRLDGIIFLASNLCGTGTEGIKFVKDWLKTRGF